MTAKARTADLAIKLLAEEPEGLGYSILIERLAAALPDIPVNTIRGSVVGLLAHKPGEVYKPAKGLFQHTMYGNGLEVVNECVDPVKVKEEDFCAHFAEYLTEDLEECTKCIPLGGCSFKDKWGTPDVIGIRRVRESDIINFPRRSFRRRLKQIPAT